MLNKIISYEESIKILTSQKKFHINLGLERVLELLEIYGNPQEKIKCIHVAGTNGKGSTCAILASILHHAGYKTGLYTSPHLIDYTERLKINGIDISKDDFAYLISDIIQTSNKNNIPATEFEILTVLAFIYFCREKVDFAVVETGLGGRLDATNVIKSTILSIITSIDYDHTDRLGNTINDIAFEKAGIIKPHVPIITHQNNNGTEIIETKAHELKSDLILAEDSFSDALLSDELSLKGIWQQKNLSLVIKAVEVLRQKQISIEQEAVISGLKNVFWPGRFQYIKEYDLILDGAHNPGGAKLLRETLDKQYYEKQKIWIYSSINTKNYAEIMQILFKTQDIVILTQSNYSASVPAEILFEKLEDKTIFMNVFITNNIDEALKKFFELKNEKSIGILAGSLYSIGDFLTSYGQNNSKI